MPVNTTRVVGEIRLPQDTVPENSAVHFKITGFDTDVVDNVVVAPRKPQTAQIQTDGTIDINLWPNDDGTRSTLYNVELEIYNGNSPYLVPLGQIEVPQTAGPHDLTDLLPVQPPADTPLEEYLAQLQAAISSTEAAAVRAETAAVRAETAQAGAEAAEGGAQLAQIGAEAARDAAFVNADVYADIATGRAAVADGEQFMVVSADRLEIIRYERTSSSTQDEVARYPTSSRVTEIEGRLDAAETIGRGATPVAGAGAATAGTYAFSDPVAYTGTVTRLRAYASTGVTIKVRRFTLLSGAMTQVGSDTNVALSTGANDVEVSIAVNAGEHIGFYNPASGITFVSATGDSGGYYYSAGDVSSYTDGSAPRTTTQLQIGFDLEQPRITQARLDEIEADVDANFATSRDVSDGLGDIAQAVSVDVESHPATTQFGGTAFGEYAAALLLDGVAEGTILRSLTLYRQYVAGTATKMRLEVYQRPDGETTVIPNNCVQVFEQDFTLAELGLTAGGTDRPDVVFTFPTPFVKEAGKHLAWMAQALDGTDTPVSQSFGYLVDAGASQSERGWYRATAASPTLSALASPNRFASSVSRTGYSQTAGGFLALADATITVDGTDLVVSGSVTKRGAVSAFSDTVAVSLAAAGKERMDLIQVDRSTLAVSLVAGDVRDEQLDSLEHQNAATANNIIVGRARVTDAVVQAVSVAGWRGLVKTGTEAEMAFHVQRNRDILRPLLSKAQRAQAINLGGYGDSITAIQSGTPAYTANGTVRDRGHTYLANYPADSLALVPLYDFGDGAGTVHTKLGWNWSIKAALDAIAGSEVVTYLNYGRASSTSANSEHNGLWPARIAEPLGDSLDAVVIAFGMNERGQTYTYANIVNMIGQFQGVGTACVVMGCPRPNANQSLSAWRYTNDALEAAAMDAGAAYVSTAAISDDLTLGGMGVPAEALASANTITGGNNHPGIWELDRYGAAAVLQTGL